MKNKLKEILFRTLEIVADNVIIDGRIYFEQHVKNMIFENIRKVATGQDD